MRRKRFSVEQVVAVLNQAELGLPVADLVRLTGISEQTFYRWKKQYAGLESTQVRELKQLSEENARLKKLVAGACQVNSSGARMSHAGRFQAAVSVTDFHSAIAVRRCRWMAIAERRERGGTKRLRTAERFSTNL